MNIGDSLIFVDKQKKHFGRIVKKIECAADRFWKYQYEVHSAGIIYIVTTDRVIRLIRQD